MSGESSASFRLHHPPLGIFVVIEGADRVGKSSAMLAFSHALTLARGVPVVRVREPGGTSAGEAIRTLLKSPEAALLDASDHLRLFNEARHALMDEVIRPELARGRDVIADRHTMSTYVYQGAAGIDDQTIELAIRGAVGGTTPDVVLVLTATPAQFTVRCAASRHSETDTFNPGAVEACLARQAQYIERVATTPHAVIVPVADNIVTTVTRMLYATQYSMISQGRIFTAPGVRRVEQREPPAAVRLPSDQHVYAHLDAVVRQERFPAIAGTAE